VARVRNKDGRSSVGRRTFIGGIVGAVTASAFSPRLETSRDASATATTPVLGANLNGRPHRLLDDLELLDVSDTTWVRAFIDVRKKLQAGQDPSEDPDVVALRRVARRKDCNLVVNLKWDFAGSWGQKAEEPVPDPNSSREVSLFQCAARYLDGIGVPVDVVVLGNEPLWETPDEDLRGGDPAVVRFTRRVKDYLVDHYDGDPTFLAGAFNRLDDVSIREFEYRAFHERTFDLIRNDDDIAGADLHVHFDGLEEAKAMVATARSKLPDSVLVATEFSPVFRYDRHTDVPIDRSDAGRRFAEAYGIPSGTTAVEYFEAAKENPISREELADFFEAMPWYNEHHVADVYDLFDEYDVSLGALGFLQGVGMRGEDWTTDWTPFHVNFLFQRALLDDEHGAHPSYLPDYRDRTGGDGSKLA